MGITWGGKEGFWIRFCVLVLCGGSGCDVGVLSNARVDLFLLKPRGVVDLKNGENTCEFKKQLCTPEVDSLLVPTTGTSLCSSMPMRMEG